MDERIPPTQSQGGAPAVGRNRRRVDHLYRLARRHGPTAPIWRRRAAIFVGAIALGLVALLFARLACSSCGSMAGGGGRRCW
jgi:hypothetical protein